MHHSKFILASLACAAVVAVLPAAASARHGGRSERAAGMVSSFDQTTRVLTLTLGDGTSLSGLVDRHTRIQCRAADTARIADHGGSSGSTSPTSGEDSQMENEATENPADDQNEATENPADDQNEATENPADDQNEATENPADDQNEAGHAPSGSTVRHRSPGGGTCGVGSLTPRATVTRARLRMLATPINGQSQEFKQIRLAA